MTWPQLHPRASRSMDLLRVSFGRPLLFPARIYHMAALEMDVIDVLLPCLSHLRLLLSNSITWPLLKWMSLTFCCHVKAISVFFSLTLSHGSALEMDVIDILLPCQSHLRLLLSNSITWPLLKWMSLTFCCHVKAISVFFSLTLSHGRS